MLLCCTPLTLAHRVQARRLEECQDVESRACGQGVACRPTDQVGSLPQACGVHREAGGELLHQSEPAAAGEAASRHGGHVPFLRVHVVLLWKPRRCTGRLGVRTGCAGRRHIHQVPHVLLLGRRYPRYCRCVSAALVCSHTRRMQHCLTCVVSSRLRRCRPGSRWRADIRYHWHAAGWRLLRLHHRHHGVAGVEARCLDCRVPQQDGRHCVVHEEPEPSQGAADADSQVLQALPGEEDRVR